MTELDPRIAAVLDQLEQQSVAGMNQNALTELDQLEAGLNVSMVPQQMAQEVGPLQAAGYQFGGNLQNLGLGAQNSLLMGLNKAVPGVLNNLTSLGPMAGQLSQQYVERNQQTIDENREQYRLNRELLGAIQDERPFSSFGGDALTFVAELAGARLLGGPAFQGSTKGRTLAGRTAQEAMIGAGFGATATGLTDDEKEMLIAHSLLIGAISPTIFSGIGRAVTMRPETIKRITEYARMEKMLGVTGLLTVGEITGHRGIKKLEAALDNIPALGLARKRDRQFARFQKVTDSIYKMFGGDKTAPEHLVRAVQRSFNRLKKESDTVYDDLARRVDAESLQGNISLTLKEFWSRPGGKEGQYIKAARRMLAEEMSIDKPFRNKEMIDQLESIIGKPNQPRTLTFDGARRTLRRIQDLAGVQQRGAAKGELTRERLRAYRKLEVGLIADMEAYASMIKHPQARTTIMQDLKAANQQWKDSVLPFYEAPTVQDIVGGTFNPQMDIDGVVAAFLNPNKPGRSKAMMGLLEPNDKDIARYLVVREAFDRSMAGKPSQAFLDPRDFASNLKKMGRVMDTTFTPEQQMILNGYQQLIEEGSRAFGSPSALGTIVAGSGAAMIGANKYSGGAKLWQYGLGLTGAKFALGTRAGTGLMKNLAKAQSNKEVMALTRQFEVGFMRFLEAHYDDIWRLANPDMADSPYAGFNPFTDPYIKRHEVRR